MQEPALTLETTHGNLGLQQYLKRLAFYAQNIGTGYIKGEKWYCDPAMGGDGKSWQEAAATVGEILSVAGHDDVIYLAPGVYEISANLLIEQNNLKLIGASGMPGLASVKTVIRATGVDSISIDSHGVEIAGMTFEGEAGYWCIDVPGSNDSDPTAAWIHHNYFYAHEQGSVKGVSLGNREAGGYGNAVSGVVEDCFFFKCGTTALNLDASRAKVARNTFVLMHTASAGGGIVIPQSGTQRDTNEIVDNRFVAWGTPNDAKGINLTATPTVGTLIIDNNKFINFANAGAAINKLAGYSGKNFFNNDILEDTNPPTVTAH